MSRKTILLLGLCVGISAWLVWARLPTLQPGAANLVFAATSPLAGVSPLQPAPIPSVTVEADEDWPTYTHPTWGITFHYPPDWEVEGPESLDLSGMTSAQRAAILRFGHSLTLAPAESTGFRQITISMDQYTLSQAASLEEWVGLRTAWDESSGLITDPRHLYTLPTQYTPAGVDEAIYSVRERMGSEIHTLWLASSGLVYAISPRYSEPEDIALVYHLAASLEFAPDAQAELLEEANFVYDENDLRDFVESMRAEQEASESPLTTATRRTPSQLVPDPTPTPRVYATVTPSAMESPLVRGLQRLQGNAIYEGMSPFELWYDPTLWQLAEGSVLLHQEIEGCVLHLVGSPGGAIPLAPVTLAGYDWGIFGHGSMLSYSMKWENGNYIFQFALPTLPTRYDPENKSTCELDAEAVIDTFTILDTP